MAERGAQSASSPEDSRALHASLTRLFQGTRYSWLEGIKGHHELRGQVAAQPPVALSVSPKRYDPSEEDEELLQQRSEAMTFWMMDKTRFRDDLKSLKQDWVAPLQKKAELTKEQCLTLFLTLDYLIILSDELVSSLDRIQSLPPREQLIGAEYLRLRKYLGMFSQYSANYSRALEALRLYRANDSTLSQLLSSLEEKHEGQTLESMLEAPCLQMDSYWARLEEILLLTPKDHPDYKPVFRAVIMFEDFVSNIENERKLLEKNAQCLLIESRINGVDSLYSRGRHLLAEVESARWHSTDASPMDASLYLFSDALLVTNSCPPTSPSESSTEKLCELVGLYPLDTIYFEPGTDDEQSILLYMPDLSQPVHLSVPSSESTFLEQCKQQIRQGPPSPPPESTEPQEPSGDDTDNLDEVEEDKSEELHSPEGTDTPPEAEPESPPLSPTEATLSPPESAEPQEPPKDESNEADEAESTSASWVGSTLREESGSPVSSRSAPQMYSEPIVPRVVRSGTISFELSDTKDDTLSQTRENRSATLTRIGSQRQLVEEEPTPPPPESPSRHKKESQPHRLSQSKTYRDVTKKLMTLQMSSPTMLPPKLPSSVPSASEPESQEAKKVRSETNFETVVSYRYHSARVHTPCLDIPSSLRVRTRSLFSNPALEEKVQIQIPVKST